MGKQAFTLLDESYLDLSDLPNMNAAENVPKCTGHIMKIIVDLKMTKA